MTDNKSDDVLKSVQKSLRNSESTLGTLKPHDTQDGGQIPQNDNTLSSTPPDSLAVTRGFLKSAWDKTQSFVLGFPRAREFLDNTKAEMNDVKNKITASLAWRMASPVLGTTWKLRSWAFNKAAFKTDESGTKRFAPKKAAMCLAALMTVPYWGPVVGDLIDDAIVASTPREQAVYVMDSFPVKGESDVYDIVVKYDKDKPPSDENTDYFRIKPNFWLNAWSWGTKAHPYLPENISKVARAANGEQCELRYGGIRIRPLHFYYTATGINCESAQQTPVAQQTPPPQSSIGLQQFPPVSFLPASPAAP